MTQNDIAELFGLSQNRISQIKEEYRNLVVSMTDNTKDPNNEDKRVELNKTEREEIMR